MNSLLDELVSIDNEKRMKWYLSHGFSKQDAEKLVKQENNEDKQELKIKNEEIRKKRVRKQKEMVKKEFNLKDVENKLSRLMTRKLSDVKESDLIRALKRQKL